MNKYKKKYNKKNLFFLIGLAYAALIPFALIPRELHSDIYQCFKKIALPVFSYLVICAVLYKQRNRVKRLSAQYHVIDTLVKIPAYLYKYRWLCGTLIWLIFVYFQIHGSAIGVYTRILEQKDSDSVLIGFSRPDRFDEWLNMTSFALSQYVPGPDGSFSYFNPYLRAIPTDIFILLGQPCWDICTLFRPFLLGYLFLPPGNGLAFFWMGRLIFLGLVSYEFARLWTDDNRKISWFYTLMITLSPAVQWWFAVNEFVEMLIAGQASILIFKQYLQCNSIWQRLGWALILAYFSLMYIYVMYPAWQIPFAYIFLVFAIYIMWQFKGKHVWHKCDILCLVSVVCVIVLPIIHTLHMSADAIALIRASEYPGHRFVMGGGLTWDWLFNSGLGLFTPFSALVRPQYAFNLTQFFDFAPLGLILAVYKMIKEKHADFLLCSLLSLNVIFILFCLIPWPRWLVLATLLFQVPEGRMIIPVSYVNILLILRTFALWSQPLNKMLTWGLAGGIAIFSSWASFHYCEDAYLVHNVIVLLMVTAIGVLCICRYRRHAGPFLLGLFLCIGGMINPVDKGVSSVYDTSLAHEISNITSKNQGKWLVVDSDNTILNNYPPIFGAPTINSYNTYAAWDNWNKLDLNDSDRGVLNRCTHIKITEITESASTYKSEHGDIVSLTLQREDVKHLGVQFILSDCVDLQPLNTDEIQFEPIAWANGHIIYQVNYQEAS